MRASISGPDGGERHVSGAERLVKEEEVEAVSQVLMRRARERYPEPDIVYVTVERIAAKDIATVPPLHVTTITARDPAQARGEAARILRRAGVGFDAIAIGFDGLDHGLAFGGCPLRGAAICDLASGERLDRDPTRGVRATRFDYEPGCLARLRTALAEQDLTHFRVAEALAVATKALWSGVIAELCWSDDPDYVAGYVATRDLGYVRFPHFKPSGAVGGRVFYVDGNADVDMITERLERKAVMIDGAISVS